MYDKSIKEMIEMSCKVGSLPDYTQGGGGNTSVKIPQRNRHGEEEHILYVKGSGWDLETIEDFTLPKSLVKAIIERPTRIATRLGIFAALINAVAPKAYEVVMNTAFELFPDSAAAKGDRKALKGEAEPSGEQIAFASLMRGVHW